ncbi:MAG: GNAT family N-acetyltransferase [Ilumatobacteraceae bacterium]
MIDIRTSSPEEYRTVAATVATALLHAPSDDEAWAKRAPSWEGTDSLAAWDGDRCVGHVGAYRVETVVPGGRRLPTAAVSRVGVLPTHRRRGLARDLMNRLLIEGAQRGQALASLRASEAVIYGRFGFGIAGRASEVTVDPTLARPVRAAAGGSVRLLSPDEVRKVVPPLYDRFADRPGIISRTDAMWDQYYEDAAKVGGDAHFVAVHSSTDGDDDGFVHYTLKWREEQFGLVAAGDGEVFDLFAATPAAELALWAYLCDLDLIRRWHATERPIDDLVRLAVNDPRAYHVRVGGWDEQWLRLLDVDEALRARSYADAKGSVTIAVTDDLLEINSGVWSIDSAGAERAAGVATQDADLSTDIAGLSAAYLGDTPWTALAAVERVTARTPDALARADALFATSPAPFCGSFF